MSDQLRKEPEPIEGSGTCKGKLTKHCSGCQHIIFPIFTVADTGEITDIKLWAIALIAAAIIGMLLVGMATSTTGHFIKTVTNGTFIEHSGESLEFWGNDLIRSAKLTMTAILAVTFIAAVAYVKSKP